MPDYSKAKIYKIRSHQTDDVYVGSTCQRLCDRMTGHRRDYERYKDGKHNYVTSFKMLEYDDAHIELVENYPCLCREGLCQREGEIIRETDNCVNKYIAGRTPKRYYQEKGDEITERNNANRIQCDCGGQYIKAAKPCHVKSKRHQEYERFMSLTEEQVRAMLH